MIQRVFKIDYIEIKKEQMLFNFLLTLLILNQAQSQYSDLVLQMDGVFTKLNSNETEASVIKLYDNIMEIYENINSQSTKDTSQEIFTNVNEILSLINSNTTRDILHNIQSMTENSKVYVDISDQNWNINRLMIYVEVLLVMFIVILATLFGMCLFKFFKKRNQQNTNNNSPNFEFYKFDNSNPRIVQ